MNRNQPRKRLDLTLRAFAEWVHGFDVPDAFLYLHVAPTGDMGYDIDNLAAYYNLHGRIINADPGVFHGASEETLAKTYGIFDVQISTTVGEGWGLTTMEGMACGVPQIVPDWSALGEWAAPAAKLIRCQPVCGLNKMNQIGGEVSVDNMVTALDHMYHNRTTREIYRDKGLDLVKESRFRWENIAEAFTKEIDTAVESADA